MLALPITEERDQRRIFTWPNLSFKRSTPNKGHCRSTATSTERAAPGDGSLASKPDSKSHSDGSPREKVFRRRPMHSKALQCL